MRLKRKELISALTLLSLNILNVAEETRIQASRKFSWRL